MKKVICLLLALLILTGCQSGAPAESNPTTVPEESQTAQTVPVEEVTQPEAPWPTLPEGTQVALSDPGKARLTYEGSVRYARCITCVEELPDLEALKGFDEEFFREHDLLIVLETLGSGSVQVDLDSVVVQDGEAVVKLSRKMNGQMGTADMATWLLWATVDKGLGLTWKLENSNLPTNVQTH